MENKDIGTTIKTELSKEIGNENLEYGNVENFVNRFEKFLTNIGEFDTLELVNILKIYKFLIIQSSIKDMTEKGLVFRNGALSVIDNQLKCCYNKLQKTVEYYKMKNEEKYNNNYIPDEDNMKNMIKLFSNGKK